MKSHLLLIGYVFVDDKSIYNYLLLSGDLKCF